VEGLKSTKTGTTRVVPLLPLVRQTLLDLIAANLHGTDGFLLYGERPDAPLDVRAIERGFYKALRTIGIDEEARIARSISFHSLRHWSNAMLRGSVADSKLRLLTGHSTEAMTARYDHATDSDLQELARALDKKVMPLLEEQSMTSA
jgi:integrase